MMHCKTLHEVLLTQQQGVGRVLIVGDVAIDEMAYGVTERLSREAPVLILRHDRTDILLGAAGNAAHNVAALSAKHVTIAGTCGDDDYAPKLRQALLQAKVSDAGLVVDSSRPTTTKTRISGIANHSVTQQIVRMDRQSDAPISVDIETQLNKTLTALIPQVDAVLLSDYGLGVVTPAVIQQCRTLTQQHAIPFCVDSHQDLTLFQGATVLTPNQTEAEKQLGYALTTRESRIEGGLTLLDTTQAKHILLTLGGDGMMLFKRLPHGDTEMTTIPAFNRSDVFDVTGAGDTVVGTFALMLANGVDASVAAVLGNLAASIVVKRYGTAVTSVEDMMELLLGMEDADLVGIQTEIIAASSVSSTVNV